MIYTADIDGKPLYRAIDELNLINPKLKLEVNKSGSFTFKMAACHPRYDDIRLMTSEITIYQNDEEIWRGRPIRIDEDFNKNKSVECEGELAYLNDIIQPPKQYQNYTPLSFLNALLTEHNKRADDDRKFEIGEVTVTDDNNSILRYTNFENTLTCINDKLIKQFGGYLKIRHEHGKRYIDYLQEINEVNDQVIRFGVNIIDFSTNFDVTDIATAIIPLGARQDEKDIEALEKYLTIESVNNGKNYLVNEAAKKQYGYIEKVVKWDDVTLPDNLKTKGEKYLTDYQFDTMQLELTAVDMANLEADYESIKLMQTVRVVSKPHGLDKYFPVTKLDIALNNPANDTFTLGLEVSESLTSKTSTMDNEIKSRLDETATISSVKQTAVNTATELIKSGVDGGHVVTSSNEILIMDNEDKTKAKNVWRFNQNGIGYSKTGYNGTYGTAITMDGQIVADYITAGTLSADRIKGGTLTIGGKGYNVNGKITILNKNNKATGAIDNNGAYFSNCRIGDWSVNGNGFLYRSLGNNRWVQIGGKIANYNSSGKDKLDCAMGGYNWAIYADGESKFNSMRSLTITGAIKDSYIYEDVLFIFKRPYGPSGKFGDTFEGAVNTLISDYVKKYVN